MSRLTLVRHAQASFFSEHYDQLSALGESQSQLLAEHWLRNQRLFDELYVGPRQRHQQTATLIAEGYRRANVPFPEPVFLPDFDEYDLAGIFTHVAPALAENDPEFAHGMHNWRNGDDDVEKQRNFQRMFERLLIHWQDQVDSEGLETWHKFRERVLRAMQGILMTPGKGRRIAVFTSGGFIGTITQLVLGAPERVALELSWRIANTAVTEFVFTSQRTTLDSFNCSAHLVDRKMVTYR